MKVLNDGTRQNLISLYMETDYFIPDLNWSLTIGQQNRMMDDWLSEHKSTHAVFITAFNPQSKALCPTINKKGNLELIKHLDTHFFLPGIGISRKNDWIPEESFLVIDLPLEQTLELMLEFGQLAVVWHQSGQASRLLWRDRV